MAETVKVFVSYSWGVEEETKIVDDLEVQCPARNIQLIRDRNEMKHGDSIREFIDQLTGGEHVVTVFSKQYFKSKWCMLELYETWRKGSFKERTHPIIADDCDLGDTKYRLQISDHWELEHKTLKKLLKKRDSSQYIEEFKELRVLRDIALNINDILNFAKARLTTPLDQLQAENYSQLLKIIRPVPDSQSSPDNTDKDFLEEIKKHISIDLKKSPTFFEHLAAECGSGLDTQDGVQIHLINQCLAGDFVSVIQNLESAYVDSVDLVSSDNFSEMRKLHKVAEGIVAKLVLFNVRNQWMEQYSTICGNQAGNDHVLPEMSPVSVEVVVSREAKTIPQFKLGGRSQALQSAKGVSLESGIGADGIFRDAIKRLYKQVIKTELGDNIELDDALKVLRETIQQRSNHKNLKLRKNYFLHLNIPGSPIANPEVQKKIKAALPELSFIRLKAGEKEDVFVVEDVQFMVAIRSFYTTLEDYKPNE